MSDEPIAILASSRSSRAAEKEPPHLWPVILLMLILLAVAVAFFGARNGDTASPAPTTTDTPVRDARVYLVSYRFGVFSPTNLRIHAGDTVRFRNDSATGSHIVSDIQPGARTPEFDSIGDVAPASYFSYTFANVGTFAYSNASNNNESGIIIVR